VIIGENYPLIRFLQSQKRADGMSERGI